MLCLVTARFTASCNVPRAAALLPWLYVFEALIVGAHPFPLPLIRKWKCGWSVNKRQFWWSCSALKCTGMSETAWKELVCRGSEWVTFKAKQQTGKRKEKDLCLDSVPKNLQLMLRCRLWSSAHFSSHLFSYFYALHNGALIHRNLFI